MVRSVEVCVVGSVTLQREIQWRARPETIKKEEEVREKCMWKGSAPRQNCLAREKDKNRRRIKSSHELRYKGQHNHHRSPSCSVTPLCTDWGKMMVESQPSSHTSWDGAVAASSNPLIPKEVTFSFCMASLLYPFKRPLRAAILLCHFLYVRCLRPTVGKRQFMVHSSRFGNPQE